MKITLYVFYTSIWSKTRPNLYYGNQTIWSQIKYILYRHITNLNRFFGAVRRAKYMNDLKYSFRSFGVFYVSFTSTCLQINVSIPSVILVFLLEAS